MSRPIELPLSHEEAAHLIAALRVAKDLFGDASAAILMPVAERATALLKEPEKTKGL